MLLVVDDIVTSMDVWEWYHSRKDSVTRENNMVISAFRPWLNENQQTGEGFIESYGELLGYDFYLFLHEVFKLFTDIQLKPIDRAFTVNDIEKELLAIENRVVFWALTEGHEKADFGPDMRNELLNSNTMSFNRKFHVEAFYKMKAIWKGFHDLKKCLQSTLQVGNVYEIPEVDIFKTVERYDDDEMDAFLKIIIRLGYGGDFDEFIISVMERIKFITMNEYHEKLALIKAFEMFGKEDFDVKLPYSETWRMLFNDYFDDVEDIFKSFYERFTGHCVLFTFIDYLSWDHESCGINYIPIYKLYTDTRGTNSSSNIRFFINPESVRRRIRKLYNIRVTSDNVVMNINDENS